VKTNILKAIAAISCAAVFLALAAFPACARNGTNQFHVLVLAERGGQHEAFVVAALEWLKGEAARDDFAMDVFENPDLFSKAFLARYQVFIQLNYPPYRWSGEARAAFQDYIEQGRGGWVGFHHATLLGEFDGYPIWPWFSDFMGGIRFKDYIANRVAGTVVVEDAAHPCLKGVPSTFVVGEEEWYTYDKDPRPNVHVLAHVDESSYAPPSDIKMGDHPVIWTNEKMKARNVYILMGHHPSLFKNQAYKTLFHNAILWAAGDKNRDNAGDAVKPPTGSFLELGADNVSWTRKQWEDELGAMKRAGMDTLIINTTARDKYAFCRVKSCPLYGKCGTDDPLDTLLDISEKLDLSVYLGFYSWNWHKEPTRERFQDYARKCNQMADELWANYGRRKAFSGWYALGWEMGDAPDKNDAGVKAYRKIMKHLRSITPKLPILISPYFSLDTSPKDMEKGWTKLLGVLKPDILAPQDGVGCDRGLTPDNVKPYFSAYRSAARAAGVRFWANVEVFDLAGSKPAPTERIVRQLQAVSPYVDKVIIYEYNHNLSEVRGQTGGTNLTAALKRLSQ
jgi:type 1 glutamine amidotransferase